MGLSIRPPPATSPIMALLAEDQFLGSRGQLHPGPVGVGVVGNHGSVVAACSGQLATVPSLLLQIADNCSLRHLTNGHHVSNGDLSLFAAVNKLSRVHAFGSHEQLLPDLVPVRVTEVNDSQRSAGVVDDVTDHTLDVTVPLSIVHSPPC